MFSYKLYVVAMSAIVFATIIENTEADELCSQGGVATWKRHPVTCSSLYTCVLGKAVLYPMCSSDQVIATDGKTCVPVGSAQDDCSTTTHSHNVQSEDHHPRTCQYGETKPNPASCARYSQCVTMGKNSMATVEMECPYPLLFDSTSGKCDHYNNVKCQPGQLVQKNQCLDPADPDFSGTELIVHLDKTDAMFVDVIHSDGSEFDYVSGFGWMKEVGHVDFYPNGGENQPGCPPETFSSLVSHAYYDGLSDAEDVVSCSHSRSIYLFTESINSPCKMIGHPCPSIEALDRNQANCFRCSSGACPEMGYNSFRTRERGKFYLRTRGSAPFCGQTQHVEIEFGAMGAATSGHVRLEIVGRDQTKEIVVISSDNHLNTFVSGGVSDLLTVDRERIDDVIEVRVTYFRPSSESYIWWFSSSGPHFITVSKVTVTSASDGRSIHFCGEYQRITNGNTVVLRRSSTDPRDCLFAQRNHVTLNRNRNQNQ